MICGCDGPPFYMILEKHRLKSFTKNGWTFHGHEFVGSKMVYKLFKRLRLPLNNKLKLVQKLVLLSSRPIVLATEVTDAAVRRLVFDAGDDIESLMLLCEADITTKNPYRYKQHHQNFERVREKIQIVEERIVSEILNLLYQVKSLCKLKLKP